VSAEPTETPEDAPEEATPPVAHRRARLGVVPGIIVVAVVAVLALGAGLYRRATGGTNEVAVASAPKGVTVVEARSTTYRSSRRYVGTTEPWLRARLGPQLVAAFVDTVLHRPGAVVKKGEVVATLDCRNQSAKSQAVALAARALETKQTALAHEAARISGLADGGFVSANEVEKKIADSASQQAELLAARAKLMGTALEVDDCVLRSPFDGEIETRSVDPGAFAKPGTSIVSVVDRTTIRISLEVPEIDFAIVAPGQLVKIHVVAADLDLEGTIARRAPAADPSTRTVHCEIDVADPARGIPVGTTAEVRIDVGEKASAVEIPLNAASVRGTKASVFVVKDGKAHALVVPVLGERAGMLFVEPTLASGSWVVSEGRALLSDGDRVDAKLAPLAPASSAKASAP